MEPEIARRCVSCGASVRGTAFYCPECGKPIKGETVNLDSSGDATETPAQSKVESSVQAPASVVAPAVAEAKAETETEEGSKLHRMTGAAREAVEGKIAPQVEKLRHASNVMFEEVSHDPSLRFVLVALGIFLLSLLLLFLNHVAG